MHDLTCYGRPA